MTKEPVVENWCAICLRVVYGELERCPVCLGKLIPEAT